MSPPPVSLPTEYSAAMMNSLQRRLVKAHGPDVSATTAETERIATAMLNSDCYLEYGAGGTTYMACEAGIQTITSIETSLDFCRHIIHKYELATFIQVGRLKLHHAFVGETGDWGRPIRKPLQRQVQNYLSWPSSIPNFDLGFIDGRYRVAVAAAMAVYAKPGTTLMFHDYFNRPRYHLVEDFLDLKDKVGTLAIFETRNDKTAEAKNALEKHFHDAN